MIDIKDGAPDENNMSREIRNALCKVNVGQYFDIPLNGKSPQHRRTQVYQCLEQLTNQARIPGHSSDKDWSNFKITTKTVAIPMTFIATEDTVKMLRVSRVDPVTFSPSAELKSIDTTDGIIGGLNINDPE